MLVLTRKPGEEILIGDNITVTILTNSKGKVRVGISAPDDVGIVRSELIEKSETKNTAEKPPQIKRAGTLRPVLTALARA